MARPYSTRARPNATGESARALTANGVRPGSALPGQPDVVSDDLVAQLLEDIDDPTQWGEVEEVGPGFYRAPKVARQLARVVATYRVSHGQTQKQLARTLALHQSQVARLESGQRTPTLETLVRLARHLGLTLTVTVTPSGALLTAANPERR